MKRFLANWELKVLAVISAIIFWFLVIGTENTFYTFPEEVPVKAFNLADNLVVSGDLPTVTLRLKIDSRETVKNLTVDDFSAFIDLDGQKEGQSTVRVEVSSKSSDIAVVKVDPSEITVDIEKVSDKEVPVDYKIEGDVAEGYSVKDVELDKENVVIKGSSESLDDVYQATALISLDNNKNDLEASVPLVVYDEKGDIIEDISFEEDEVGVKVSIASQTDQKILGVQPSVTGNPNESVWIESIDVDPAYVIAEGDQQILETLDFVSTQEVNVEGLSENKTFMVSLDSVPEGISIEDDSLTVTITVQSYDSVDSTLARKTVNIPLVVKKFKTVQRDSTLDPPSVTLVAEGDQEDLDKIDESMWIDLDISNISQSGGTVEVSSSDLKLPGGVNVVSLTPSEIKVTWDQ